MPGNPWTPGASALPIAYTQHNRLRVREGRLQPAPEFVIELVAPPNAPSDLVCTTISASAIGLVWVDNSTDETGFRIQRAPLPGGPFATVGSVGAGVTTFTDMGLPPSTPFSYRIIAFNASGDSAPSNVDTCTTDPTPPGPGRHEPGKWLKRYWAHRVFAGNRLGDWIS